MNILQNNPYRVLGVYSNSPTKERLANHNRMKAFLKVGRPVSFPLDLPQYLSSINRTEATVADADAELTLPKDQILYAQFWFVKITPLDDVAFNHLVSGEIGKAEEIWKKKECASSLQNLVVCSLMRSEYDCAMSYAEKLYGSVQYVGQLTEAIVGTSGNIEPTSLAFSFLDTLCDEIGASKLLPFVTDTSWKSHIGEKTVKALIDSISDAIDIAKESKGKGSRARFDAGMTLMKETKSAILQLKKFLSPDNLQYQVIVDKLGLEILQCGIDYYNDSEDSDAAHKAMVLHGYANSIVVGQRAKERCEENVQTLERIISKLPPLEVIEHHEAIKGYLKSFAQKDDLICYSIQLIKDCAPHIVAIKEKLGKEHQYYLEISTIVVNEALGNVIAEVNAAQEKDFDVLKETLISAWQTQLYMDKFDIQTEYKNGRFKQSRQVLYDIIKKCKGFELSGFSFMYTYGCGWCNHLDVSDLDLQTEEECYQSCCKLASYKYYLKKYPFGKYSKHAKSQVELLTFQEAKTIAALENFVQQYPQSQYITQAKKNIVELRFKECKTINDFQKFINDFPNSRFVSKAKNEINKLIREENKRKARMARQEKALSVCKTTNEVVALYESEKTNKIDLDKCSSKAFELAENEDDYRKVVSVFGARSTGGHKAIVKTDEIERLKREKAETKSKIPAWTISIVILLLFFYLRWRICGLAICCAIIALTAWWAFWRALLNGKFGMSFIYAAIAVAFGFSAIILYRHFVLGLI